MKSTIKELIQTKRFKALSLTCILLILVLGVGLTLALVTDVTNALQNTFAVDDLTTHIEENVGTDRLKEPVVVNDGSATAFIRARVTVSPDYWTNKAGDISLQLGSWTGVPDIRTDVADKEDVRKLSGYGEFTQYNEQCLERIENMLFVKDNSGLGWYFYDGWFYFNQPVEKGEATTPLFDAVIVGGNITENFDVTIYQEAVASKPYLADDNKVLEYTDITQSIAADAGAYEANKGKSVVKAFEEVK